jgi:hypothetical protein
MTVTFGGHSGLNILQLLLPSCQNNHPNVVRQTARMLWQACQGKIETNEQESLHLQELQHATHNASPAHILQLLRKCQAIVSSRWRLACERTRAQLPEALDLHHTAVQAGTKQAGLHGVMNLDEVRAFCRDQQEMLCHPALGPLDVATTGGLLPEETATQLCSVRPRSYFLYVSYCISLSCMLRIRRGDVAP